MDEKWTLGTRVTKIKGSNWTGKVVGFYSTDLTPEGYAVESETERGSVQIYPRAAIERVHSLAVVAYYSIPAEYTLPALKARGEG